MSGNGDAAGARIARARRRRGLSQAILAGLIGRSESWLSQVERGKRGVDSHAVLTRMAAVLRVQVEELTGPDEESEEERQRVYVPAAEIERAMMGYDALGASIWAWPTLGAAWTDPACWVLRLMASGGHSAHEAERQASRLPAFRAADPAHIDLFVAANVRL